MTSADPGVKESSAPGPAGPGRAGRAVLFTGLTLGVAVVITLYWDGWHPRIPGMPAVLGYVAGFLATAVLLLGLTTWAAELTRRHHKALARHAGCQGKRAAVAGARAAGSGYRKAAAWAGPRWQGRHGGQAGGDDSDGQQQLPEPVPAGERPGSTPGPGVTRAVDLAGAPAPACTEGNGDRRPMTTQPTVPSPRAPRARLPARVKANAPAGWQVLASATSDYEPGSDEELLDWMASEVAGISSYGEAITDLYETCIDADIRLDPVAMAALHDAADASADFAAAMAYARQKFASHYAEVREFVAAGGVLPKDGDFITGEGED